MDLDLNSSAPTSNSDSQHGVCPAIIIENFSTAYFLDTHVVDVLEFCTLYAYLYDHMSKSSFI